MKIGVPREIHEGEQRVATTPDVVSQLIKLGFSVAVEKDAGAAAGFSNEAYEAAGCEVLASAKDVWSQADLILKVRAPEGAKSLCCDLIRRLFVFSGQAKTLSCSSN